MVTLRNVVQRRCLVGFRKGLQSNAEAMSRMAKQRQGGVGLSGGIVR